MLIRVLGAAAGGGFPQWNCGCPNCKGLRAGQLRALPRTQDSVAVSAGGDTWVLLNCSPEIRGQIEAAPVLHPRAPRHTPIAAVVLVNGDLDHCLGLLSLRESQPIVLYATETVYRGLADHNVFFRTLRRFDGQLTFRPLILEQTIALAGPGGENAGLEVTPFAVPGKVALHLEGLSPPPPEDNIGLLIRDPRSHEQCAYVPAAATTEGLSERLRDTGVVFFDGTFYHQDELGRLGLGTRTARDMAHAPIDGPEGSLATLCAPGRRIYIHINNTNPILVDDSPERRRVEAAGWEVAWDGMEINS